MAQEGWTRVSAVFGLAIVVFLVAKISRNKLLAKIAQILLVEGLLTAYAYRNPQREPLGRAADFFYAPVDGKITNIQQIENEPTFLNRPAHKMQFSSHLLDVPVIRAPFAGQVRYIYQQPNEPVRIGLESLEGQRILLEFQPDPQAFLNLPVPFADSEFVFLRTQVGESLTPSQILAVRGFGRTVLTTLYYPAKINTVLIKAGWHTQAGMTVLGRVISEKYRTEESRQESQTAN